MKHLKTEIYIQRHIVCQGCKKQFHSLHTENNCDKCGWSLVISAKPIDTCPFCGQFLIYHNIPWNCNMDIATITLTVDQSYRQNMLAQDRDGDWWHVKYDDDQFTSTEYASNPAAVCDKYRTKYNEQMHRLTEHANRLAGYASRFRDEGGKNESNKGKAPRNH